MLVLYAISAPWKSQPFRTTVAPTFSNFLQHARYPEAGLVGLPACDSRWDILINEHVSKQP